MDSKFILEKSTTVGGADFNCRPGRSVHCDARVPILERNGPMPAYTNGPVPYKCSPDGGSPVEVKSPRTCFKGNGISPGGRISLDMEKNVLGDQKDTGSSGILKRASPTCCPGMNGQLTACFMQLETKNPVKQGELALSLKAAQGRNVPQAERQPFLSSHIPVPRNRRPSGHADKEVMAATVLTSLSTSPLVLCPSAAPTVPEPANRVWKEVLSASYSSSTSGNWSWDASDQSVPSTPSPPLSNDTNKNFLLLSQGDDVSEDVTESTHFMFEDPIPRKRKNSMKVMFKCLWKNCEKVLSTSSGIQRHIRTVHLGRNSDSDYSDGEEDFYYSEIEVNMDSLTEGLSNLAPTSPTTVGPPPAFPPLLTDASHSENIGLNGFQNHAPTLLSQSAPSALCHIRTDHAYQATAPVSIPVCPELAELGSDNGISVSWQSPPVIFKGASGPVNQVRTVSIGEKRQPATSTHTTVNKSHALITQATKSTPGSRKPRGEAKKCRKVYGMEKRDMWCTACRWKKACQRFTD
ncbi:zinc finger protein 704 isoform X1 [Takifugu rubripes]|uniref:zinc finger protein 704 isoform X1 n=2 Tax=Takifugu rubripes TaxID=31033 RepID=UPI0005D278BD|nr:zinc finger protein 704 isoform X1 [Takifugu rubripes]|eukprot:XP_011600797.1 PREDICTED: SLC2A4 regulator [Takifugu rubripes]